MTAHNHAEFLHAIADGDAVTKWECRRKKWNSWDPAGSWLETIVGAPADFEVRRKPDPVNLETRTYECWDMNGLLGWCIPGKLRPLSNWFRVPSEDKTVEVVL